MATSIVFTVFNLVFILDFLMEKDDRGKKYRLLSYMFFGTLSLLSIQVIQGHVMVYVFSLFAVLSLACTLFNEFVNPPNSSKERVYNGIINMLLPVALYFATLRWFPSQVDMGLGTNSDLDRNIFIIQTLLVLGMSFKFAPTLVFNKTASKEINEDIKSIKL